MCGKYFLVITARDVEYCKNINESGYSCAKLASIEKYKESLNDPFLKEYSKINETMYQRYYRVKDFWYEEELSGKDMTSEEYYEWSQEAQPLRSISAIASTEVQHVTVFWESSDTVGVSSNRLCPPITISAC